MHPSTTSIYLDKGGWIHILEATIAVLIVAGVMVSVYSDQSAREVLSVADYSYSLQNQILEEIATRSDLRSDAMRVVIDLPTDTAYDVLDAFVAEKIPADFGYLLRVCNLGDTNDYCKMPPIIFYATLDRDVFVEDVVISSEIGDGTDVVYSPKKVRLFLWDGGFPEDYCRDECMTDRSPVFCSTDLSQVLKTECGEFDADECVEYGTDSEVVESCGAGEFCTGGACVASLYSKVTCKLWTSLREDACDVNPVVYCAGHDGWFDDGDCNSGNDDEYSCFDYLWADSECSLTPTCPSGYSLDSVTPCVCVDVWTPSEDSVCSGSSFSQTSSCGNTRNAVGTKNCACVPTSWLPSRDSVCSGSSFVQTSNCGTTQNAVGTQNCVAVLSASYSNLCKNCGSPPAGFGGGNWWYYDVTLSETGGEVGVTVNSRQKCDSGSITPLFCSTQTDIVAKFGSNYIPAGGSLVANNEWLWTDEASWTKSETYFGVDGNSNAVSDSYSFTVN